MQGNWKNNVSGWDRKDNKRKKQTHNNVIKDKARAILKVYNDYNKYHKIDDNIYRNETILVTTFSFVEKNIKPIQYTAKNYKIRVYYPNEIENINNDYNIIYNGYFTVNAYLKENSWNTVWINSETNKNIFADRNLTNIQKRKAIIKKVKLLGIIDLDVTEEIKKRENSLISEDFYGEEFIYGKPLPNWKIMTLYNDGKRRKYAQNTAHSADRRIIRDWIKKEDWDKPLKTHALSKSILWEVC